MLVIDTIAALTAIDIVSASAHESEESEATAVDHAWCQQWARARLPLPAR
jgi:Ribonuclease G/E